MADGSITFSTELDNSQLEKQLQSVKKKIDSLESKISQKQAEKMPLVKQSAELAANLDRAQERLEYMRSGQEFFSSSSIKEQETIVKAMESDWDKTQTKVESYDAAINKATIELNRQKDTAGGIVQELDKANSQTSRMPAAIESAGKSMDKFISRVKSLAKRVLVFSIILSALRKVRDWMGKVIKTNSEASAAMAKLRGALLTMAQPLVSVVVPAFTFLVNVLTRVISALAQMFALLTGKSISSTKASAKALQEETDALDAAGGAAKDAGGKMADFDEINTLASDSGGGAGGGSTSPDFDFDTSMTEGQLQKIFALVKGIGAGLLAWKLASALGLGLDKALWLFLAIYSAMTFVQNMLDAWNNGVDWDNFAGMLAGMVGTALGLGMAFGPVAAGISLVVTGLAMLATGFRDAVENGLNLKNMLTMVAGIVATGLGFFFLTGSVIPLVIAGIVAVVAAVLALTGNLGEFSKNVKNILGGITKFIKGVFTLDFKTAIDGLGMAVKGLINADLILIGSFVNAIIKGINWLISKINTIKFTVPDWVPGIGGNSVGFKLPPVKEWQIPRLAAGAVIPPNREFMAVLGDQKRGNNIEAPEELIRRIVREESAGQKDIAVSFEGSLAQFIRQLRPVIKQVEKSYG